MFGDNSRKAIDEIVVAVELNVILFSQYFSQQRVMNSNYGSASVPKMYKQREIEIVIRA